MLSQVEREAAVWLHETNASWNDDIGQLPALVGKRDALFVGGAIGGLLDKVNDDKLARDVEDLSAIFEELEGGVVDFPLPCDEEEVATGAEVTGDWIGDLEKDVVNVDELSSMFDALVEEQSSALDAMESEEKEARAETSSDDESMEDSDEEYDDEEDDVVEVSRTGGARAISVQIIPAAPTWATSMPLDPRSAIRTPVFQDLDSRIPRVNIPRMDLAFGGPTFTLKPTTGVTPVRAVTAVSPKPCKDKKVKEVKEVVEAEYHHDPASCWICKSDKTPFKKYALHRYLEKRHRRNWKRGPRYSGRSNVATNRVREGGRFVTTAHWV